MTETGRVAGFWRRHFLGCELAASVVLTLGACALVELTSLGDALRVRLQGNRGQIYSVAVGAFVSAFGFLMAVATLVAQSLTLPKFDRLRRMSVYPQLWRTYWSTFRWLGVGTAASAAALVWDRDADQSSPTLMYTTLGSAIITGFRAGRCVWILVNVVRVAVPPLSLSPPEPARPADEETVAR